MTRVAALVLSHNDAATIGEAVASLAAQPRAHELAALVLADDASADDSITRAQHAAGPLNVVVLTTEQNLGQWHNLNRGLQYCENIADWVLLLHADDIVVDGWLDALLERIGSCADNVASISCSWDELRGGQVDHTGERNSEPVRHIAGTSAAVHDTLLSGCWWKISGAGIRLRAFAEVGEFDAKIPYCGDWEWLMRALARGWSFEYLPRVYVHYRLHAASVAAKSLRTDVEIADAITVVDRYGYTLNRAELIRFHFRRGYYVLRRLARGVFRRDLQRVSTSFRTWRMLGGHLLKQLAG